MQDGRRICEWDQTAEVLCALAGLAGTSRKSFHFHPYREEIESAYIDALELDEVELYQPEEDENGQ